MNASRPSVRSGRRAALTRAALGLAVVGALATSACAAGQIAATSQEKSTGDFTNVNVGQIGLRGLAVATPDANNYPVGSKMRIIVTLVNDSTRDDQLLSVSSTYASGWGVYASADELNASNSVTGAAPTPSTSAASASGTTSATADAHGPVSIDSGAAAYFGEPTNTHVLALLETKQVVYPGTVIPITFTFKYAGSATVPVPIQISGEGSFTPKPSFIPSVSSGGNG